MHDSLLLCLNSIITSMNLVALFRAGCQIFDTLQLVDTVRATSVLGGPFPVIFRPKSATFWHPAQIPCNVYFESTSHLNSYFKVSPPFVNSGTKLDQCHKTQVIFTDEICTTLEVTPVN